MIARLLLLLLFLVALMQNHCLQPRVEVYPVGLVEDVAGLAGAAVPRVLVPVLLAVGLVAVSVERRRLRLRSGTAEVARRLLLVHLVARARPGWLRARRLGQWWVHECLTRRRVGLRHRRCGVDRVPAIFA